MESGIVFGLVKSVLDIVGIELKTKYQSRFDKLEENLSLEERKPTVWDVPEDEREDKPSHYFQNNAYIDDLNRQLAKLCESFAYEIGKQGPPPSPK